MSKNTEASFWSHVSIRGHNGCWLWLAGKDKDGYGKVSYGAKHQRAHRVAYQFVKGEIPDGLIILHSCDTPSCVNPAHLFPGTHQDNIDECVARGRRARMPKLTASDEKYVRHLYNAERQSKRTLAKFFDVSVSSITKALNRRTVCLPAT